jgi:hypothetical protein
MATSSGLMQSANAHFIGSVGVGLGVVGGD